MSQGFDGQGNHVPAREIEPTEDPRDLLRSVLDATLAGGGRKGLSEAEWRELHSVAQAHRHQTLGLSTISELLVGTLLRMRLGERIAYAKPAAGGEPREVSQRTRSIAATWVSDPTSLQRLTQFWSLLQETA